MLWVLAPQHYNFPNNWNLHRQKFSKCLESAVQLYAQMSTLKLLKIWNYDDSSLLRDKRFTAAGLQAYWASLDSAFRHQDTFIVVKQSLKGATSEQKNGEIIRSWINGPRSPEIQKIQVQWQISLAEEEFHISKIQIQDISQMYYQGHLTKTPAVRVIFKVPYVTNNFSFFV